MAYKGQQNKKRVSEGLRSFRQGQEHQKPKAQMKKKRRQPAPQPAPTPQPTPPPTAPGEIIREYRVPVVDGPITNQYNYWNRLSGGQAPYLSDDFDVESGALFSDGGDFWTGVPDNGPCTLTGASGNNSAIFRLGTKQTFLNTSTCLDAAVMGFTDTATDVSWDPLWDGMVVWMRCQPAARTGGVFGAQLYAFYVGRRDGVVMIKKKQPGGTIVDGRPIDGDQNHGHYYPLTREVPGLLPLPLRQNRRIQTYAINSAGSVHLALFIDGVLRADAIDNGTIGGPPILLDGSTGVRGDNAEIRWRNMVVRAAA